MQIFASYNTGIMRIIIYNYNSNNNNSNNSNNSSNNSNSNNSTQLEILFIQNKERRKLQKNYVKHRDCLKRENTQNTEKFATNYRYNQKENIQGKIKRKILN